MSGPGAAGARVRRPGDRHGRRRGAVRPAPLRPGLIAGGLLFVVSDGLVATRRFGPKRRAVAAAVMATYAAAQALLTRAPAEE